jgi:hypothetical protein
MYIAARTVILHLHQFYSLQSPKLAPRDNLMLVDIPERRRSKLSGTSNALVSSI